MIVAFNLVLLFGLLVLLLIEEMRFRQYSRRVANTRSMLITLSHRLRSPITTIRKFNAFFRTQNFGGLSMAQAEALSKMEAATAEAVMLLNRLLAASRIEEEKLSTQPMVVNLTESVQSAINAVAVIADRKRHTITFQDHHKHLPVFADPLFLHGIFDELLMNAVSYTPEGGTITVTIRDEGKTIGISVQDAGIGIPEEEAPYIFDKFFRGEKAMTMEDGHGLGLCFARQLAEDAGGSIGFKSTEAVGSTFSVTLPKTQRKS